MIRIDNLMVDHHPDTGSHLTDTEVLPPNEEGNGDMALAIGHHTLCKSAVLAKDHILVAPTLVARIIQCRIPILRGAHHHTKDIHNLHRDIILHHRDNLRLAHNIHQKR